MRSLSIERAFIANANRLEGVEYEPVVRLEEGGAGEEGGDEVIEIREGRPNFVEVVGEFKGDVFTCGPEAMKEDIRRCAGVELSVGGRRTKTGVSLGRPGVAVLEEIFEW